MGGLSVAAREAVPDAVAAVIDGIEADVIRGAILPQARLIEDHLMEDYGAKRHAVRAALEELERLGIVVKPRHRGAELRRFSLDDIDALYATREILHRAAVARMRRPGSKERDALHATLAAHETAAASGDPLAVHRTNMSFHEALFSLCGNRYLVATIRFHDWLSFPIRAFGLVHEGALTTARAEHRAMVDRAEAGDFEALADLAVRHMRPARQIYAARFISPQLPGR